MFNVFSKAFLDKKNIGKNASATSNALLKPSNTVFLSKNISENARGENEKTKHMSLKERLASVRNAQNVMGKTNANANANANVNANLTNKNETTVKEKPIHELKKGAGNEVMLPHFKNYATIVNERNVDRQNEEEMEKKLKKRKRRKKHEMLMEKMKQQGKGKYDDHEDNNNEEDEEEEEEPNNSPATEEVVKKRRPGRPSKNKQEERHRQEEKRRQEEEAEEEERSQNNTSQNYDNYRNSVNSVNNRNSAISNHDGEPVKQKRKRRKKKEMEALRAQGLIGKGPNSQNNLNRNSAGTTNATNNTGQEENKVKRRRGRPKIRGNTQNNVTNDKSKSNDSSKGTDIRKYWSKNDDDNSNNVGVNGNVMRTESNNFAKENDKRREPSEREGGGGSNKQRNIFNIITSARENDGFMKKTPSEIENLERSYKHNVKSGVTCIPLNYQENGGGMCIIFIDTNTEYGPIKNYHGFMTFLVLECDPEQFFIETGITHNVVECEKHMQLLISPGDTYAFKNNSHELEAKLLLIACNKMTVPLDLKNHIRDPTVNQEKG